MVTDSTCIVGFNCAMKREKAVPYAIEAGCDMFLFNKDLDEDFDEDLDEFWDDEDDDVEIVEIDLSDQDDEDK